MTLIAHVSDPHFGTELPHVCAALRNDLLWHAPDLIVLTGDITQRARSAQFRAARAFLQSLAPIPVLALPGNHDLPLFDLVTRFTDPYRLFRRHVSPQLEPAWRNPAVAVLGVNSTRALRHKHGVLPADLVRQVAERLAALAQPFKVVALHHPLAVVDPGDRNNLARGAERAVAAWIEAGADLFLGGHIHLPYCVSVGDDRRRAVLLQAGTAVSWRCRAPHPNSYNLIRLEQADLMHMRFEQRNFDRSGRTFSRWAEWGAIRAGSGWTLHDR